MKNLGFWIAQVLLSSLLAGCGIPIVREFVVYVPPKKVSCVRSGVQGIYTPPNPADATSTCYQMSESPSGPFRATDIAGFDFVEGNSYKLRIRSYYPNNGMADVQTSYNLIKVLEKTLVQP